MLSNARCGVVREPRQGVGESPVRAKSHLERELVARLGAQDRRDAGAG
jgi:hypothetical protein